MTTKILLDSITSKIKEDAFKLPHDFVDEPSLLPNRLLKLPNGVEKSTNDDEYDPRRSYDYYSKDHTLVTTARDAARLVFNEDNCLDLEKLCRRKPMVPPNVNEEDMIIYVMDGKKTNTLRDLTVDGLGAWNSCNFYCHFSKLFLFKTTETLRKATSSKRAFYVSRGPNNELVMTDSRKNVLKDDDFCWFYIYSAYHPKYMNLSKKVYYAEQRFRENVQPDTYVVFAYKFCGPQNLDAAYKPFQPKKRPIAFPYILSAYHRSKLGLGLIPSSTSLSTPTNVVKLMTENGKRIKISGVKLLNEIPEKRLKMEEVTETVMICSIPVVTKENEVENSKFSLIKEEPTEELTDGIHTCNEFEVDREEDWVVEPSTSKTSQEKSPKPNLKVKEEVLSDNEEEISEINNFNEDILDESTQTKLYGIPDTFKASSSKKLPLTTCLTARDRRHKGDLVTYEERYNKLIKKVDERIASVYAPKDSLADHPNQLSSHNPQAQQKIQEVHNRMEAQTNVVKVLQQRHQESLKEIAVLGIKNKQLETTVLGNEKIIANQKSEISALSQKVDILQEMYDGLLQKSKRESNELKLKLETCKKKCAYGFTDNSKDDKITRKNRKERENNEKVEKEREILMLQKELDMWKGQYAQLMGTFQVDHGEVNMLKPFPAVNTRRLSNLSKSYLDLNEKLKSKVINSATDIINRIPTCHSQNEMINNIDELVKIVLGSSYGIQNMTPKLFQNNDIEIIPSRMIKEEPKNLVDKQKSECDGRMSTRSSSSKRKQILLSN